MTSEQLPPSQWKHLIRVVCIQVLVPVGEFRSELQVSFDYGSSSELTELGSS